VFGAGGGLGGPAGGVYVRLAEQFVSEGIASLRLDYRHPGDLINCILDVMMGIEFLSQSQHPEVILVGHSFGGAVVISAGALSDRVIGVAALSSQNQGTDLADRLAPKPLLVAHGLEDEVLPAACSRSIYARAGAPKELILYPNCRHGLDECREELDRDLTRWIREIRESLLSVKSAN
jgi:pimeloyl-ACP methyl ester carboxylesterase